MPAEAPSSDPSPTRPPLALLAAVFGVAACVLGMEITLTRIFSAVLKYHFSFLVISLAICGLGLGGMLQALFPGGGTRRLAGLASGIGLAAAAGIVVFLRVLVPNGHDEPWWIAASILAPFVLAGAFLAVAFQAGARASGLVYASDLFGSALAVPAVVLAMTLFDPVGAFLCMAAVATGVGLALSRRRALATLPLLSVLGVLALQRGTDHLDVSAISAKRDSDFRPLYLLLSRNPELEIVRTEWGPYARTDVVRDRNNPARYDFFVNGTVPTTLLLPNPSTGERAIPGGLLLDLPFAWRRPKSVLTIGPGAGLDILFAKLAGAEVVDGAEVNPAVPGLLERYCAPNENPYRFPGVDIEIADGRTYVAGADRTYELLVLALTKAGTGSVGSAMVECFLYTEEAVERYLDVLADDGVLAFVSDNEAQTHRFLVTVLDVLERRGVPKGKGLDQIALVAGPEERSGPSPYSHLLLVGRRAFEEPRLRALERDAAQGGYRPQFLPGTLEPPRFSAYRDSSRSAKDVLEEQVAAGTFGTTAVDLHPVNDDSPYFSDLVPGVAPGIVPMSIGTVVTMLVLSALVAALARARAGAAFPAAAIRHSLRCLGYFSLLGMGFLAIEIPFLQILILILGHPSRALTVALFSILLGASAGSLLAQRISQRGRASAAVLACLAVLVTTAAVVLGVRAATPALLETGLVVRVLVGGLSCAILGLAMGMPFPLGIALARRGSGPVLVPWIWGVNGLASVLGGLFTAAGAKAIGFPLTIALGASSYVLAALLALGWKSNESAAAR